MAKFEYRFFVADVAGRRSSPWQVKRSGNHVYVIHSAMGSVEKFSFQPPDICRLAETKTHAEKHSKIRTVTRSWQRAPTPPLGLGKCYRVLSVVFGTNVLSGKHGTQGWDPCKFNVVPAAPPGKSTCVDLAFTYEGKETVKALLAKSDPAFSHTLLAYDTLPDGQAIAVSSYWVDDANDALDLPAPADRRISKWGHLVVSEDDPDDTGRPVRVTIYSDPQFGDCMYVWEFGAYEIAD